MNFYCLEYKKRLKKIVQNGFFLQSEKESVISFLVVTFHQSSTVDKELLKFNSSNKLQKYSVLINKTFKPSTNIIQ